MRADLRNLLQNMPARLRDLLIVLGTLQPDGSMTARMRRVLWFTAALLALIVGANAAILARVVWNRLGEPEAELVLSAREFTTEDGLFDEDSGRFVRLKVRDEHPWLDAAKLRSLGFRQPQGAKWDYRATREVFLALELREESGDGSGNASRLVAVDAALDAKALRQLHPDRTRCAIIPAAIRVWGWDAAGQPNATIIGEDRAIFVPRRFAPAFAAIDHDARLTLAFGKRLEPWVRGLEPGPGQP